MMNSDAKNSKLVLRFLWNIAITTFFAININYEWRKGYFAWYGSLIFVVVSYLIVHGGRVKLKMSLFAKWLISFVILGLLSIIWCQSSGYVIDIIKSCVVYIIVLLLLEFSIEFGYNVDTLLKGYLVAIVINSIYVFLTIDVASLGDIQIGDQLLEGWNGNGIGFMASQGAFIAYYLFGRSKSQFKKLLYVFVMLGLCFLTIYTGSRTAFIVLVLSFVIYLWMCKPTKIVRNLIVTLLLLCGSLYLVMNIESLYKVLGMRLEGLFSLFSGQGKVDSSADIRDLFIQNGKKWFLEKPIVGYGLNNYKVLNGVATGRYTYAHNTFVELAVGLGCVGLIWYYSAYAYLIKRFVTTFKNDSLNRFLFVSLLVSLISQYGTVSYYEFYQNLLLMLCFYVVAKTNKKRSFD